VVTLFHAMHTVWEHVASMVSAVCRLILRVMHYVFVGVWRLLSPLDEACMMHSLCMEVERPVLGVVQEHVSHRLYPQENVLGASGACVYILPCPLLFAFYVWFWRSIGDDRISYVVLIGAEVDVRLWGCVLCWSIWH
jgi:hypothetical protein